MNAQEKGQKIKDARKRANMTQESVAALFGEKPNRQAVQNWESGKSFPKPARWPMLEQAFGLPQGWFMALKSGAELPVVVASAGAERQQFDQTMHGMFQRVCDWWADEHSADGYRPTDFFDLLDERIPEYAEWRQRKRDIKNPEGCGFEVKA